MTSLLLLLGAAIVLLIVATARWDVHPFLALLGAALLVGLGAGLGAEETIEALVGGFGGTIGYIGIVIAAGSIIGVVLERSGGALVMAETVVRWVGRARSMMAMSLTGAVVSVPVFCDSGFVILSPLARSLADRSRASYAGHVVALAMGLYATHVFVPPTPGPIAAAGELGAEIGTVILYGLVVTLPVLATTYLYGRYLGPREHLGTPGAGEAEAPRAAEPAGEAEGAAAQHPRTLSAFAPVLLPVLLIAARSIVSLPGAPLGTGTLARALTFLGNPNVALLLGVVAAAWTAGAARKKVFGAWAGEGLRQAGTIILITGAGGAFGRVLQTTPLGSLVGDLVGTSGAGPLGVFVPFVVAAVLKTALGSSTVAIITTASIMTPLLPVLGLAGGSGPALAVLAIGAGSMTVSHANDSYFWVVSQFSGMTVSQAYRLHTGASAVAGITGIVAVFVLYLLLQGAELA